MSVLSRNNVKISGSKKNPIIFSHGFGCDQNMWRFVAPAFEVEHQVILFDHVGAGNSDTLAYSSRKYSTLNGYVQDVIEILEELKINDAIFVGHSVSAMIGVLAAVERPDLFSQLVLVGPSPCYINDPVTNYIGGFEKSDIEALLESLDSNYLGWSAAMAPVIMGNPQNPSLGDELTNSFCRTHPEIAKQFARATFLTDNRLDLNKLVVPALVLQCMDDVIAPICVGEYVASSIKNATFHQMAATGHCPNLSAPEETIEAIKNYLG